MGKTARDADDGRWNLSLRLGGTGTNTGGHTAKETRHADRRDRNTVESKSH